MSMRVDTTVHLDRYVVDALVPESPSTGVLLWHGTGTAQRLSLRPLAVALAKLGVAVVVPDLHPARADPGLRHSLWYAEELFSELGLATDQCSIVGWSDGAVAGVGAVLGEGHTPFRRAVGLAGDYTRPNLFGQGAAIELEMSSTNAQICLLHGDADNVSPASRSVDMHERLNSIDVTVELTIVPGDHASIVLTRFDPTLLICVPTETLTPEMAAALSAIQNCLLGDG